jgi:hypothetical protein
MLLGTQKFFKKKLDFHLGGRGDPAGESPPCQELFLFFRKKMRGVS